MGGFMNLLRDERGGSVIELALVAPFLSALTIGVIDISSGYGQKLQLEQAAQRAVEKVMQTKRSDVVGADVAFYNTLKTEGATAANVPESQVTVRYWLECNGVSQNTSTATMAADYEKVCPPTQTYARYFSVRITKTYTPMIKAKFVGMNANGTFTLVGESLIRVQ